MTSTGEPLGAAHVAPKRRVGNLLGLAVLSYLTEGPMHPYQLSRTLRDNGDARSIKFNPGSLYMVVAQLARAGLITEVETTRVGQRPERTVYGLTDAGRRDLRDWLRELIGEPQYRVPAVRGTQAAGDSPGRDFEPPLFADNRAPASVLTRFDQEMAEGDVAAALVTGMKGAQMAPPVFNVLPRWLLQRLTAMAMAQEDRRGTNGYLPMRALAPTLHHDFPLVAERSGSLERFRTVAADLMLLSAARARRT